MDNHIENSQGTSDERLITLVEWIRDNFDKWEQIEGYFDGAVDTQSYIEKIEIMAENQMYDIALYFISATINKPSYEKAAQRLFYDLLAKAMRERGVDTIFKDYMKFLKEENDRGSNGQRE